jgi:hypothetical protein
MYYITSPPSDIINTIQPIQTNRVLYKYQNLAGVTKRILIHPAGFSGVALQHVPTAVSKPSN